MSEIEFVIGDLVRPGDAVGEWITVVAMGWNDLALANRRLLSGMEGDTPLHERLYDAKLVVACLWEISKFLRESEQFAAVAAAIEQLPARARTDYHAALAPTDPYGPDTWFKRKLVTARDAASHYPELSRKSLTTAIRKVQSEKSTISFGKTFGDLRVGFADDVSVELVFPTHPKDFDYEFGRFVEGLVEVVPPLMRFLQAALRAHLRSRQDHWSSVPGGEGDV